MAPGAAAHGLLNSVAAIGIQQLLSRLIPFFLHTAANNKLTPEDASLGSVRFQLLQGVVYSVGREGFRRGCLRASSEGAALRSALVLLPLWALISTLVCWAFSYSHPLDALGNPQAGYQRALVNYWLALLLEGAVEPLFILGTFRFDTTLEVVAEVCGRVAGAAAFAASVLFPQVHAPAAIAYSRGQLAYAVTMAAFYFGHAALRAPQLRAIWRAQESQEREVAAQTDERFSRPLRAIAAAFGASHVVLSASLVFGWQAVQKMMLQDAGRFVMTGYSAHVAGVYGEVQNLGSLVVRIVFWPIENAAFRTFSRLRSSHAPADASPADAAASKAVPGATSAAAPGPPPAGADTGLRLLSVITRLVVLVALLACTFGPPYAFSAIHVLLSATWSATEAPLVLSAYCAFLLFMAVNGVLEAYVHATMSTADLKLSNAFMVAATVAHVAVLWIARTLAEDCLLLVAADAVNMALRIAFAAWCIRRQHQLSARPAWSAWLPSGASLLLLVTCSACMLGSERVMMQELGADVRALARLPAPMLKHIGVGVAFLAIVLTALWKTEAGLIRDARALLRPHAD